MFVCLFVGEGLFCFLRKMVVSFPNQSSEWLARGRRAQPLGGLAASRKKSFWLGKIHEPQNM